MSEGEGGYKPPSQDKTLTRRTFLKDVLKVGAGTVAGATVDRLINQSGQQRSTEPVSSQEKTTLPNKDKPEEILLFEANSKKQNPIRATFQISCDKNVSPKDKGAVQAIDLGQMAMTAVSLSDMLITIAQDGKKLTQEQREAFNELFVHAEREAFKIFQLILFPKNTDSGDSR